MVSKRSGPPQIKMGAMVAYNGVVKFTRESLLSQGLGNLEPQFKKDISFKTFLGRGSGESIQMLFEGEGFVVVQPYEEVYMQAGG